MVELKDIKIGDTVRVRSNGTIHTGVVVGVESDIKNDTPGIIYNCEEESYWAYLGQVIEIVRR